MRDKWNIRARQGNEREVNVENKEDLGQARAMRVDGALRFWRRSLRRNNSSGYVETMYGERRCKKEEE
ncbi:hypothetical protein SUGI_0834990 [Cryptomeria japonica]|nr:hypothetical protein SUGI_0834990 [Cryptomeria japonica]